MGKKKTKVPNTRGFATKSIPKARSEEVDLQEVHALNDKKRSAPDENVEESKKLPEELILSKNLEEEEIELLSQRLSKIDHYQTELYFQKKPKATSIDKDFISAIQLNSNVEHRVLNLLKETKSPLDFEQIPSSFSSSSARENILSKLDTIYLTLLRMGFRVLDIEEAMRHTLALQLSDVLDYLCITLPEDSLPNGWVDKVYYEEKLAVSVVRNEGLLSRGDQEILQTEHNYETTSNLPTFSGNQHHLDNNLKSWILNYANNEEATTADDPELSAQNPNETYADLKISLINCQRRFATTKKADDEEHAQSLLEEIENITKRMKALEVDFEFDKQAAKNAFMKLKKNQSDENIHITVPYSVESSPDNSEPTSDEENIFGGLLDESYDVLPSSSSVSTAKKLVVHSFETSGWTGSNAKDILHEYLQSHYQQFKITYRKLPAPPGYFRSGVDIQLKNEETKIFIMPETDVCRTNAETQNYAATLALFNLTSLPLYKRLPPLYKELWLEWSDAKEASARKEASEKEKDRFRFLINLLNGTYREYSKEPVMIATVSTNLSTNIASETMTEVPTNKPTIIGLNIQKEFKQKQKTLSYQNMLKKRCALPVHEYRNVILDMLDKHQVVIVSGETGCGKSTQVPQYIVENHILSGFGDQCNVICTQPRRISAISIAHRVSTELGDPPRSTGSPESLVGYQIRLESKISKGNVLVFCTTGILLRRLESDPHLNGVTHVVVDEVHERGLESDFLLILLRRLLAVRWDLRVVLMSATLDAQRFSAYFNNCPVVHVPGRTFPVTVRHLEDVIEETGYVLEEDSEYAKKILRRTRSKGTVKISGKHGTTETIQLDWEEEMQNPYEPYFHEDQDFDPESSLPSTGLSLKTLKTLSRLDDTKINYDLICHLLEKILFDSSSEIPEGAILIFLPGMPEIRRLHDLLMADQRYNDDTKFSIWPLHSLIGSEGQDAIFETPPAGVRKIVLATNIAETGITIPDCTIVIDTGKVKQIRFDERVQITNLQEIFVSKANARQRRGRAGRVQEGLCYHLFTKQRYENEMVDYQLPEIMRLPLYDLCLKIKVCNLGSVADVLAEALDAPPAKSIKNAIKTLQEIQALSEDEKLTPLGVHLSRLPLDVHIGKMILFGSIFQCLDPVLTIAAILSFKSPFLRPFGKEHEADAAREKFKNGESDFLIIYKAYLSWKEILLKKPANVEEFCRRCFLSHTNLIAIENLKSQFMSLLAEIGFVDITEEDRLDLSRYNYRGNNLTMCKIPTRYNSFSTNISILNAAFTAGLYPKIAYKSLAFRHLITGSSQESVYIHPSSINFSRSGNHTLIASWFVFNTIVKSKKVYLWETHAIGQYPLLLFGVDASIQHEDKRIVIDKWIKLKCPAKTAVLFKCLRNALNAILQRKINNPLDELILDEEKWMGLIVDVLESEYT